MDDARRLSTHNAADDHVPVWWFFIALLMVAGATLMLVRFILMATPAMPTAPKHVLPILPTMPAVQPLR